MTGSTCARSPKRAASSRSRRCARENSRGAHFREDFPEPGDLASSTFTVARERGGKIEMSERPVEFTIVKPGETLLTEQAAE